MNNLFPLDFVLARVMNFWDSVATGATFHAPTRAFIKDDDRGVLVEEQERIVVFLDDDGVDADRR